MRNAQQTTGTKNAATTAYSYIRLSSPEQMKGDGPRRQAAGTAELCARKAWTLDTSLKLTDPGVSAFHGANATTGALAAFLAAVTDRTVKPGSVLIVENLDRLSRAEPLDAFDLFRRIVHAGIVIHTSMDGQEYSRESVNSNAGQLYVVLGILQRGHEESKTKSRRGLAAWSNKRAKAAAELRPMTAVAPAWIKLDAGRFRLIADKAATIRRIVALLIAGHGPSTVVRTLNAETTPTITAARAKWEVGAIHQLANNRALLGEFQPRTQDGQAVGEVIEHYYPAVLDADTFYRMQAVISTRRRTVRSGRTGRTIGNLFGSILRDGTTGDAMVMAHKPVGDTVKKYIVNRNARTGDGTGLRFSYDALEFHFLQWVAELDIASSPETSHAAVIDGKIVVARQKADQLQSAMLDADAATFPRLIQMMQTLEQQIATMTAEAEIERAKEHRPEYSTGDIKALAAKMEAMPEAERLDVRTRLRTAIAAVVSRIDLYVYVAGTRRLAVASVTLSHGTRRTFVVQTARGQKPVSASTGYAHGDQGLGFDPAALAEAIFEADPQTPAAFARAVGRATVAAAV